MNNYDDDTFADLYAQQYEKVRGKHLTLGQDSPDSFWTVYDWSAGEQVLVAQFVTEELAFWFVQAYENAPRVNDLVRKSMDDAERADEERDEIIARLVNQDFDYIIEHLEV